jgi:lipase maturation factor 1
MMQVIKRSFHYLFDLSQGSTDHFIARWLFLRFLGIIYFSEFFSLIYQVRGLIGARGILPAAEYLQAAQALGALRFWYVPTLIWFSSSDHMIVAFCWTGLAVSLALVANLWRRAMLVICFYCFLSFVSAA